MYVYRSLSDLGESECTHFKNYNCKENTSNKHHIYQSIKHWPISIQRQDKVSDDRDAQECDVLTCLQIKLN